MDLNPSKQQQNPHAVVMVRPIGFSVNDETAADNHFQGQSAAHDRAAAIAEFDAMTEALRHAGVCVHIYEQARDDTPDAVFPNNWFSTHSDGRIVTYPMFAPSRRRERRDDILDSLKQRYNVIAQTDLTAFETKGLTLEGTGAIVFDHLTKTAFMAQSQRAHANVLDVLCEEIGYTPFVFDAQDKEHRPIYHTNVMMAVGAQTVILGLETIQDPSIREDLASHFPGRVTLELSQEQIANFAGNMLEIDSASGPVLVMSERARDALTDEQRDRLAEAIQILAIPLPTIEKSGGSARCMMAGVHLPKL